ncbi:unnamed protein product [Penicillium egyptiacum]|uniref:Uncharacterized protein n=1 Tax=Penicillium egyptiacum TaxID=1303716 RepID=A0A9W4KHQ2_9EURO|nr:unnamed protein product [Penicillium egyptiacum]
MAKQQVSYDLDLGGSFLKGLPPSIKRYTYHGEEQLFDIFQSEFTRFEASTEISEEILFHASKETIETIFNPENEDASISKLCTSFDLIEQLFLVTMESMPHAKAADLMNSAIRDTLTPMGLSSCLNAYPSAHVRGQSRGKKPDYSWNPIRQEPGQPSSPSVTLEVAYSESDSKLNSDVRFWLNPDDGNANICLTLRINRSHPEIIIEVWERQNNKAHRSQLTFITSQNNQTHVSDHPLVIPFVSLFRRNSTRPGERDLAISQQQLARVAEGIWAEQGW